jgi:uncharacterized damage-inducible protein DinB
MDSEKLLRHMAWANQEILGKVADLPNEALDAYVVNPEWTVREILNHIVRSAHFYGYRLQMRTPELASSGEALRDGYIEREALPTNMEDVKRLVADIKTADETLLAESRELDAIVYREVEDVLIERARSTIIFQAVHHATEHRAQLVAALEARGFTAINLDDYDLWAYADKFGE